jgi:hypothetical protein
LFSSRRKPSAPEELHETPSAGRLMTRRRKLLEHQHTNHSKFEFRVMRASTSYQHLLKPVDLFDRFVDLIHFYLVAAFVV